MKKLETCHHCGEEKQDCYHGYIAMTIPIPEAEAKKEKWNLIDAYENWCKQFEVDPNNFDGQELAKGHNDQCWSYPLLENTSKEYKRGQINAYLEGRAEKPFFYLTQDGFNKKIKTDQEFSKQWYTKTWWEQLERTDLNEQEFKELDDLATYDQLLNTVGRGIQCNDCGRKEAELYEIYYPRSLES